MLGLPCAVLRYLAATALVRVAKPDLRGRRRMIEGGAGGVTLWRGGRPGGRHCVTATSLPHCACVACQVVRMLGLFAACPPRVAH